MRRFLLNVEILMFYAAAALLGYCGWVWYSSVHYQEQAIHELETLSHPDAEAASEGSPVGEVRIPRLGLSQVVLEGTREHTLQLAVGHVTGTPVPGMSGNICLAGHRDTFFRPLRKIAPGDEIDLSFPGGQASYRVEKTSIVKPDDVEVLHSTGADTLTLITCYPFRYFGSAPQRFVVLARADAR